MRRTPRSRVKHSPPAQLAIPARSVSPEADTARRSSTRRAGPRRAAVPPGLAPGRGAVSATAPSTNPNRPTIVCRIRLLTVRSLVWHDTALHADGPEAPSGQCTSVSVVCEMLHRLYVHTLALAASPRATWWLAGIAFAEASFFPIPPDAPPRWPGAAGSGPALRADLSTRQCHRRRPGLLHGYAVFDQPRPPVDRIPRPPVRVSLRSRRCTPNGVHGSS